MLPFGPRTVSKSHKEEGEATLPSDAALVSLYAEPQVGAALAMMLS